MHTATLDEEFILETEHRVEEALKDIVDNILATADYTREDRLWPCHYLTFATNPLSVAYGACGPALLLAQRTRILPNELSLWIQKRVINTDIYPPGLYLGLAGIACALHMIGFKSFSREIMTMTYSSPLLYEDSGMMLGVAGWGLASLYFYCETKQDLFLDKAVQAAESLIKLALRDGDKCYWVCKLDNKVHYGFGYGASGVALFLAYIYAITGDQRFRTFAIHALNFDLSNVVESQVGMQWRRFAEDPLILPYWIHGSAGIGAVLIRASRLLDVDRFEFIAMRIAHESCVKYTFVPSQFEGLSGIAEYLLDIGMITKNSLFRQYAFDMADTILWFKIHRSSGIAFPGRWLHRISYDYATGSAGIGTFFNRLLRPGPRLLMDIAHPTVLNKLNLC